MATLLGSHRNPHLRGPADGLFPFLRGRMTDRRPSFWNRLRAKAESPPFDPSVFEDPIAQATEWTPCQSGGASFGTHTIVREGFDRLLFTMTIGAKLFVLIFAIAGIAISVLTLRETLTENHDPKAWLGVLIGLIFMAVSGGLYRGMARPIVFDKTRGYYWKGYKAPHTVMRPETLKEAVPLEQIYALQLISERITSNSKSGSHTYLSYEINLVLIDGTRHCVVDHGNHSLITEQAQQLKEFLGVPLWIRS